MRLSPVAPVAVATLAVCARTARAAADVPPGSPPPDQMTLAPPRGVEVGLRLGFSAAIGGVGDPTWTTLQANRSNQWGDYVSGLIPIWLDIGYRLTPHFYVGGFFQYDAALPNNNTLCGGQVYGYPLGDLSDCSGSDVIFGLAFRYHVRPDSPFAPWFGAGVGYEIFSFREVYHVAGEANPFTMGVNGLVAHLDFGFDYRPTSSLGVGPFVTLGLGRFSSCTYDWNNRSDCSIANPALHALLMIGVRGDYALGW